MTLSVHWSLNFLCSLSVILCERDSIIDHSITFLFDEHQISQSLSSLFVRHNLFFMVNNESGVCKCLKFISSVSLSFSNIFLFMPSCSFSSALNVHFVRLLHWWTVYAIEPSATINEQLNDMSMNKIRIHNRRRLIKLD